MNAEMDVIFTDCLEETAKTCVNIHPQTSVESKITDVYVLVGNYWCFFRVIDQFEHKSQKIFINVDVLFHLTQIWQTLGNERTICSPLCKLDKCCTVLSCNYNFHKGLFCDFSLSHCWIENIAYQSFYSLR